MDSLLLSVRLVLAAVFVVAGVAKLADRAGAERALRDFGVPATLVRTVGRLLPLAEVATAVALLPAASAWYGSITALGLLLAFCVAIAISLARGRAPDCHCFGQLHSTPAGRPTLVRNGALAALAGFVVIQGRDDPGPSAVAWLGALPVGESAAIIGGAVMLGLLVAQTWLLVHLLRQSGRVLLRLDALEARSPVAGPPPIRTPTPHYPEVGLPLGTPAPSFALPDVAGAEHTLAELQALGRPLLLLFMDPNCGPCNALLPDVGRWHRELADVVTVAVVSRGSPDSNRGKLEEHGLGPVLLQRDYEVTTAYQAHGTPSAVLVRSDGTIGSPVAPGAEAIRSLVAHVSGPSSERPWVGLARLPMVNGQAHGHGHAHDPAHPTPLRIGNPAPTLTLPDLEGRLVSLDEFRPDPVLVLFWNPGCGFCQQMLPDLRAWETDLPTDAPQLLIVSTGTVEENRAQGLHSPIVLDRDFGAGRAFGAGGTPMAVLLDAEGRIASETVAGAQAVLALAGARSQQVEPAP